MGLINILSSPGGKVPKVALKIQNMISVLLQSVYFGT